MFRDFFERHSALDLITLSQSQSMEEFIGNLKGSVYYGPLYQMQQNGRVTLPACETALDMLYFRSMWKIKDKYLSKNEQKIIAQCFGTRMDMLNLHRFLLYRTVIRLLKNSYLSGHILNVPICMVAFPQPPPAELKNFHFGEI